MKPACQAALRAAREAMAPQPQVSFLVAGVQKGGTTALFDYLAAWPDVALSDVKEVHFFDDEGQDWDAPDYGAYHARFPPPDRRPCGEATPIYSWWPNALERIRAYNPAMRLILVLRDPVERAWSHWRMETARGAETMPFSWCIREGRQRGFDAVPWGHHREFSYVERGFYGEQMARLLELFPQDQVLVLRSQDLRADPGTVLARVRAHVGLPALDAPPAPLEAHVGRAAPGGAALDPTDRDWLRAIYARDDDRLRSLCGFGFGEA